MSDIKDLREKLAAKRVELKELFESSEDGKYSTEQKNEIGKRNEELASLVEEVNLKSAQAKNEKAIDADSQPVASNFPTENETLTIGEQFVKSDAWKKATAEFNSKGELIHKSWEYDSVTNEEGDYAILKKLNQSTPPITSRRSRESKHLKDTCDTASQNSGKKK